MRDAEKQEIAAAAAKADKKQLHYRVNGQVARLQRSRIQKHQSVVVVQRGVVHRQFMSLAWRPKASQPAPVARQGLQIIRDD
jgi:hypothetical protein